MLDTYFGNTASKDSLQGMCGIFGLKTTGEMKYITIEIY